jgi:hypothetical protein
MYLYLVLGNTATIAANINTNVQYSATTTGSVIPDLTGLSQVTCVSFSAWGLQARPRLAAIGASPQPTWVPNYNASLDTLSPKLTGIVRQEDAPAWATIQQVAQAYGDVAYFDETGKFVYQSHATWKARRYATEERALVSSDLLDGPPNWSDKGVYSAVQIGYSAPVTAVSTVAVPAWVATDTYVVQARSTVVVDVDLDYTVYNVKPAKFGLSTSAANSWFYAVYASMVGNPAAIPLGGVTITVTPLATGLRLTIKNPHSVAAAIWTPTDGGSIPDGPYLIIHGTTLSVPSPTKYTAKAASIGGVLDLGDNPWRQDLASTQAYAAEVAGDLVVPQIMWSNVSIAYDPRLTVGDVVTILDPRHMSVAHPVQIIGATGQLPVEGASDMSLMVRSCYPPTGWVLEVSARSVLGTTTQVVA